MLRPGGGPAEGTMARFCSESCAEGFDVRMAMNPPPAKCPTCHQGRPDFSDEVRPCHRRPGTRTLSRSRVAFLVVTIAGSGNPAALVEFLLHYSASSERRRT